MFRIINRTEFIFKNSKNFYVKEAIQKIEKGNIIKKNNKYFEILAVRHKKQVKRENFLKSGNEFVSTFLK
jgi:hypothetical protein